MQRYKINPYKVSKPVIILPFSTFLTNLLVGNTIMCLIPALPYEYHFDTFRTNYI